MTGWASCSTARNLGEAVCLIDKHIADNLLTPSGEHASELTGRPIGLPGNSISIAPHAVLQLATATSGVRLPNANQFTGDLKAAIFHCRWPPSCILDDRHLAFRMAAILHSRWPRSCIPDGRHIEFQMAASCISDGRLIAFRMAVILHSGWPSYCIPNGRHLHFGCPP